MYISVVVTDIVAPPDFFVVDCKFVSIARLNNSSRPVHQPIRSSSTIDHSIMYATERQLFTNENKQHNGANVLYKPLLL